MIYLDYNATTPLAKEVIEEMSTALKEMWGNPSSSHSIGIKARSAINFNREKISKLISANANEIVFTSGGTECNNWVIHAAIEHFGTSPQANENGNSHFKKPHVVTTTIEHDSIIKPLETLKKAGKIEVTFVPVSKISGHVLPIDIANALQPNTCLVTVMLANNETGVVQPVAEIVEMIRKSRNKHQKPIICHTDAAQAIGKIPVDVNELGVDSLTIVGHKMYGPRNGALYWRQLGQESLLTSLIYGGGQERGFRSGTENTVDIIGLGKAAELVNDNLDAYANHMLQMKIYLEEKLTEEFGDGIKFNSRFQCEKQLPNTINISILGSQNKGILSKCKHLAASSAAACHKDGKPSKILLECGVPESVAANAIRLSIGRETSKKDIDAAVKDLKQAAQDIIGK